MPNPNPKLNTAIADAIQQDIMLELLAACEQALKALAAFDGYTGEGADACKSLRSAIAKAKGILPCD